MKPLLKLFTLFVFIFPVLARAQSNFKPGYIVNLKGDTVSGTIDYREWGHNPKSIRFKDVQGRVTNYNRDNAMAFGITGIEYFERFVVPISTDDISIDRTNTKPDTILVADTIFLKIITQGKSLTLYSYEDQIKIRYIVKESGSSEPVELSHHLYKDTTEDSHLIDYDKFKTQLARYAYKFNRFSEQLNDEIQKLTYSDNITGVINKINGDSQGKIAGRNKLGIRTFVGFAVNRSTYKYNLIFPLVATTQNNASYFPELHFGVDAFRNASVGRLYFRGELSVWGANFNIIAPDASQKIEQRTISLSPQAVYNIYNGIAVKFFLGAGAMLNYSIYPKNTFSEKVGTSTVVENGYPQMDALWDQLLLKAGFTFQNHIEIYGSYNSVVSITKSDGYFGADYNSMQFGVSYLFGKK